ncbi:hypothetical protein HPOK310_0719 [Helicobacter pylori OK310]|nr:hypothetical protein HPOK310_0719 [Helicobacter pylori OK310]
MCALPIYTEAEETDYIEAEAPIENNELTPPPPPIPHKIRNKI